ncbi:hypothetical protein L0Y65_03400 [Candidatus Micrarchaeota archaeon]|nr:hypothetical protein [Candidatus Micrarchaeota archaeon]
METRPSFLLLGMAALLFSGCISIDYIQDVDREGNSMVRESVNLSGLLSAGGQYSGASEDFSDACGNITEDDRTVNCTYSEGMLVLSKALLKSDNYYLFSKASEFPYVVYALEVRRVPPVVATDTISGTSSQTEYDFTDPSAKLGASTMKTAGASFTYSVLMPGELVSAENGEIATDESGKKYARYDVLKLMDEGKYIVVKSRELDVPLLMALGAGIVLLVGGIAVSAVLLKAMKK